MAFRHRRRAGDLPQLDAGDRSRTGDLQPESLSARRSPFPTSAEVRDERAISDGQQHPATTSNVTASVTGWIDSVPDTTAGGTSANR